jgi:hypothetical protein
MKNIILFLLIFGTFACKKSEPDCILTKIENFKKNDTFKGASIDEYEFDGKTVYLFYAGDFPDAGTQIYDADCNDFCFLGGIAGFTKCNDKDFNKNSKFIKNIWKK